jgi:pepF/M3 family oligoendopeptidase
MDSQQSKLPHWNLSNVYPGLDSNEFGQAIIEVKVLNEELERYLELHNISRSNTLSKDADFTELAATVAELINRINELYRLVNTLLNYTASYTKTDSYNAEAMQLMSKIQQQIVMAEQTHMRVKGWLGTLKDILPQVIRKDQTNQEHAFYLQESVEQSRYMMSDEEESLAGELSLSGLRAWENLQGTITSQLKVELEIDGIIEIHPLPTLQNIRRYNPDESLRRRAFEAEILALDGVREPLAACMNGVKGAANTLNFRRGRTDALHPSLDQARIDRDTLNAMMGAIEVFLPVFRQYLSTKAERLGKDVLAWWDLFAPVGQNDRTFSWEEAKEFIVTCFGSFSRELGMFARLAFDNHWIDAEPRDGKRGGAFCMRIPSVEESRILVNFDGSFDQVSTIAHELGHAYHIECQRGKSYLQYLTPMTLAETASIFCESIIIDASLKQATSTNEELSILETALIGDTQVIVDIFSRFLFETQVFKRREESDLSADQLCALIRNAQKAAYGEGLNPDHLHPYMWAWKPHYYRSDISFYNYPYAFGLLFSTGLFAIYQKRGDSFVPDFIDLLRNTGMDNAVDLASRFEIDIRAPEFWISSLKVINKRIERYIAL